MKTFAFMGNGYLFVTMLFVLFTIFSDEINQAMRDLAIKLAPYAKLSPESEKTKPIHYGTGFVLAVIPYLNVVLFVLLLIMTVGSLIFIKIMNNKIRAIEDYRHIREETGIVYPDEHWDNN